MAVVVNPGLDRSAHQHWIPQVCVLSPLLFSLYINGCTSGHQSVKLLKFADDTTLIGLISDGDESAYRGEIDRLVSWCSTNNLEFNSLKTVEMTVDFRKDPAPRPPVILCDSPVSSAESFCFLGTTITKELKWEQNIRSLTKKAQQRMYFLRQLKKFLLPVKMLVNFYTAIIESVLTSSITVWFAAATARDKAKLQRVIHSAEKVIGCSLPSLQELYVSRSRRRAAKIAADPSHPVLLYDSMDFQLTYPMHIPETYNRLEFPPDGFIFQTSVLNMSYHYLESSRFGSLPFIPVPVNFFPFGGGNLIISYQRNYNRNAFIYQFFVFFLKLQKTGPNSMDASTSQSEQLQDLVAALHQVLTLHPAPVPAPPSTTSVNTITTPSTLLCASPMAKPAHGNWIYK
ncbi:hypothetical protein QTP86_008747 [Hemibagrus guttatus]|nr:hypothetical protein QTP86_008747 [Hemibagrus guttatus]